MISRERLEEAITEHKFQACKGSGCMMLFVDPDGHVEHERLDRMPVLVSEVCDMPGEYRQEDGSYADDDGKLLDPDEIARTYAVTSPKEVDTLLGKIRQRDTCVGWQKERNADL